MGTEKVKPWQGPPPLLGQQGGGGGQKCVCVGGGFSGWGAEGPGLLLTNANDLCITKADLNFMWVS